MKNIIIISTPIGHKYVKLKYIGSNMYALKIVSKLQKATIFGGSTNRICKIICDELIKKLNYEKSRLEDIPNDFENPYIPRSIKPNISIDYPMYQFTLETSDDQTNEGIVVISKHQMEKLISGYPFRKPKFNKEGVPVKIYIDDIDHYIEDVMDEF